jgi:hypothetical protein
LFHDAFLTVHCVKMWDNCEWGLGNVVNGSVHSAFSGHNSPCTWKSTLKTEQSVFGPIFEIETFQVWNTV